MHNGAFEDGPGRSEIGASTDDFTVAGHDGMSMYAVVGCGECSTLWILEGRPETTSCPTCGKRRKFADRRRFVETDDVAHARRVRAAMLAARQDDTDTFEAVPTDDELESAVADGVIDETAYLEASGLDVEEIESVGERAGGATTGSGSRRSIVEEAIDAVEEPTEDAIVAYATERGVPRSAARSILEKLRRSGEVTRRDGTYRSL